MLFASLTKRRWVRVPVFDGLVVYKKGVQVRAVLDLHGSLVWRIHDGIY